jgi:hypothetical protein
MLPLSTMTCGGERRRRRGRKKDEVSRNRDVGRAGGTTYRKDRRKDNQAKKNTRPWREMGLKIGRRRAFPVAGSMGGLPRQKRVLSIGGR